jgi:hypothetical protein
LLFHYITHTAACGGNKKARLSPRPISALPPENLWVWLRQSLEKTAPEGGNFPKSPILENFYYKARTHFQQKV